MDRIVIYTALFGDYDDLIDPSHNFEGCDFVCFTDLPHLNSNIWDIRQIETGNKKPNVMNRKYKILPHKYFPDYDISLYIDANIRLVKDPSPLIRKYLSSSNFVLPRHFSRNCLYEEAVECIANKKGDPRQIIRQITRYTREGFPKNFGLGENNILLRRHNDQHVIQLMEHWWQEFNSGSERDQLSLAFAIWRKSVKFCFMDETARNRSGFFWHDRHTHDKESQSLFDKIRENISLKIRGCGVTAFKWIFFLFIDNGIF